MTGRAKKRRRECGGKGRMNDWSETSMDGGAKKEGHRDQKIHQSSNRMLILERQR